MRKCWCYIFSTALILLTAGVPRATAQQSQQQAPQQAPQQGQQQAPQQPQQNQGSQPIPAYRSPWSPGTDDNSGDSANADPNALAPDTRSLADAQEFSLGALKTGRSFWSPHVDVSSTLDSNPQISNGSPGWTTWTSLYGGLNLQKTSGNSDLMLTYLGGGSVSNTGSSSSSIVQQGGIAERLSFRRYTIALLDQVAYTPEATFGYAGVGGPDLLTGGNLGLQGGFVPNESIVTSLGQRISNDALVELTTFVTPRTSLTFVGSYGTLIFFDNDLTNSYQATFQGGYNYLLTRKDTIAVVYTFDAFRYRHIAQSVNSHSAQLSYGRRVTGRLAFQILAGPEIAFSQTPITGSSAVSTSSGGTGSTSGSTGKTEQLYWHLTSNLTYQLRRTSVQASYNHGVSNGSGVLAAAVTDNVFFTGGRQLTPTVHGSWGFGYSRNRGAAVSSTGTLASTTQVYDYWYTNVNVGYSMKSALYLNVGYQVNYQNSNNSFCVTSNCGTSFLQHQIVLSLGWHPRPKGFYR